VHRITWRNAYAFINPRIDATGVHAWPFERSFPLEVHFWSYDRPHDIRMNRHDYLELILIDRGTAVFQIQDRLFTLNQGDMIVVGCDLFHRMIYTGVPLRSPRIMFLPELISPSGGGHENAEYLLPFRVQDSRFPHLIEAGTGIPQQIRKLMVRIVERLPAESPEARLCAKTCLKMILALLVEHYASYDGSRFASEARQRNLDRLRPALDFINDHFSETVLVKEAAARVRMSPRNFTRFFKKVTGQTLVAYVNALRVEAAIQLLTNRTMTIAEVSQAVGFCNQSYFGVIFQRLMKMTVRQYLTQLKGRNVPERPSPQADAASEPAARRQMAVL